MDDRERQTFQELQSKMMSHTSNLKAVQQQMSSLATSGRRAALTVEELSTVPEDARTYRTVGRAYFMAPRNEIIDELNDRQHVYSADIEKLKGTKSALEKGLKGVENELRELLQSNPVMAQQLASR